MEWILSDRPVDYEAAVAEMEARVSAIREENAPERVWLLEHPPLYTAGTSAKTSDLRDPRFPVYATGRGGQYTYHGPGQRVAYVMLDLKRRQQAPDIKRYVCDLEEWIIRSLAELDVKGERRAGRIGIWVTKEGHPLQPPLTGRRVDGRDDRQEFKIAAIGVRVRRWVAYHGIAINVNPDLSHYAGIVPCGISEYGVTSLHDLGKGVSMKDLDEALKKTWDEVFEPANQSAAIGIKRLCT